MDEKKQKEIDEAMETLQAFCEEHLTIDGVCYHDCPMYKNCHKCNTILDWTYIEWEDID